MNWSIEATPTYTPIGRTNVIAVLSRCLFSDVCVTMKTYRHDVKHDTFQKPPYAWLNSKYLENQPSLVKIENWLLTDNLRCKYK